MRDLIRRRVRGERGAVGVLVAILIGGGVLFGMGALVIDVGQLYQNRAELQNGADAAALAVAKSCFQGTCTPSIATSYADANASSLTGGTAYVNAVCGLNGQATVDAGDCAHIGMHCPANPAAGNYVDVETSTELPNGSHLLPPVFARTLAGNGNYQGTTVYACAQAEWGASLPAFTISFCAWSAATGNGASFAQAPPYPPDPGSSPVEIDFHDPTGKQSGSTCPSNPAGQTAPGNFSLTNDPNGDCELSASDFTEASGTYTYGVTTGHKTPPSACQNLLSTAQSNQQLLYVPVYASYSGSGSNATYTLQGFAPFALTGYNFGTNIQVADRITGQVPCDTGGVTCISGYFTQALIPPPIPSVVGSIRLTG